MSEAVDVSSMVMKRIEARTERELATSVDSAPKFASSSALPRRLITFRPLTV